MDVSSVMNTYNLTSLWNNFSQSFSSGSMGVPLVSNLDSAVNQSYEQMSLSGQNTTTELQDIYQQVEPTLNMPLMYDQNGNIAFQNNSTLPSSSMSLEASNISSLLQDSNLTGDSLYSSVLPQYDAIMNGTYQMNLASILQSNPIYNNQSSLINDLTQNIGTNLNVTV